MDILRKIDDLRIERGWTFYKLSEESGIVSGTLFNMFSRKTLPSITTLQALCDAFGISMAQFFQENENDLLLSEQEKNLIEDFRTMSTKDKKAVIALIQNLK